MPTELSLRFPDEEHVIVSFEDRESGLLAFTSPITHNDLGDIEWYIETYGAYSLGDPDDVEAARIRGMLTVWGTALFDAVFKEREAARLFNEFRDETEQSRLLTVATEQPGILLLPWELLHDSAAGGGFLFMENPRISIRRRVAGAAGGRGAFKFVPKDALHLLFVVSRPHDAGFLDPRADAIPVLDAIDVHARGRVICEFLRPPTLDALLERLEDDTRPPVDIVHFDGHGAFDRDGGMPAHIEEERALRAAGVDSRSESEATLASHGDYPPNTGYLLFEDDDGNSDFVSANKLGANLHRHKVGLVILSACQSAAVERRDGNTPELTEAVAVKSAMGSVAARLTATGIPSVLAMTHSVLVATTRILFGQLYEELVRHRSVGEALDNARRYLHNRPEKFEVQRGAKRVWLRLQDWFIPALYQQGADGALLKKLSAEQAAASDEARSNLPPAPESGFFGRRRALWEIERWFVGPTRRITITGFGGQGKTALAQEAGRWLLRTGLFRAVVFVDYASVQTSNALSVAVANIGSVLGETLIDAAAAKSALSRTPTLVILDNLEALESDALRTLLTAAVSWSEAGGSRVLCTTRRPEFGHADYRVEGTQLHRRIQLDGLGSRKAPEDALQWCAALSKLPPAPTVPAPTREALIALFDQVKFHPLSIRVLAQQLKTRRPAELGERLEQLLAGSRPSGEDAPKGLLASIELSLDSLDAAARAVLPRLGVFQGGAFEDDLVAVTGFEEANQLAWMLAEIEGGRGAELLASVEYSGPGEVTIQYLEAEVRKRLAQLPRMPAELWPTLRRQLENAALIEVETVAGVGVPYLRFHPTLAPLLWAQLGEAERATLSAAHRLRYYELSALLYKNDNRNPQETRAIAWRDLPNLLHAVHSALDAGLESAVDFADNVNRFLSTFSLTREALALQAKVQKASNTPGSPEWYTAQWNRGNQLLDAGQPAEAARVYQMIADALGNERELPFARTLCALARCYNDCGWMDRARQATNEGLAICDQMPEDDEVKSVRANLLTQRANTFRSQGDYDAAHAAFEEVLRLEVELGDELNQASTLAEIGGMQAHEGDVSAATTSLTKALALFEQLGEPAMQATCWHQLGIAYLRKGDLIQAERHYRESARIEEERGNLAGAAITWSELGRLNSRARPEAAEQWYRRAIDGLRQVGNQVALSIAVFNFADHLRFRDGRLAEARTLAEEALESEREIDQQGSGIWKNYGMLAEILRAEAKACADPLRRIDLQSDAREYRRLASLSAVASKAWRHEMKDHLPLIRATVAAITGDGDQPALEEQLSSREARGWTALAAAIRQVLAGERDDERLPDTLDAEDRQIIGTILEGIANPGMLNFGMDVAQELE